MALSVADLIDHQLHARVCAELAQAPRRAGRDSAGYAAREVKSSQLLELPPALIKQLSAAIVNHPLIALAARPKKILPPQLVLYAQGQGYGRHMDDALMQGVRTDLALTLFLNEPAQYDGGELVIEDQSGEQAFKLPARAAVLYPATYLHRVESVSSGERIVLITWIESQVRDAAKREMLFDLEQAKRTLYLRTGKDEVFDQLSRTQSNLLRMWLE